jgi:hypothetical protein
VQTARDAVVCFLTTQLDFLIVEDFLIKRRQDPLHALGGLVPSFRPVTRLAKRIRLTREGNSEVTYEIYLDYARGHYDRGPRAELSSAVFALLECVDGKRDLGSLAEDIGGLTDEIKLDVYNLWQARFFTLCPGKQAAAHV